MDYLLYVMKFTNIILATVNSRTLYMLCSW